MSESLNFDASALEIPVTVGKDKYILREASGDAACNYRNKITSCAKRVGEETVIDGPIADAEPMLVSECLFRVDEEGKAFSFHVDTATVREWPHRIVEVLFDKIQEISPIGVEGDEDVGELQKERESLDKKIADLQMAKNSPSGTTGG